MLTMHKHRIQYLSALLALAASSQFGEAQPQRRGMPAPEESVIPSDPVDMPMHRFNRLPAIDATINGKGPFRLIVDTGAAGLVLTTEIAKRLELPDPPGFPAGAAMVQVRTPAGPVSASLGYVKSLEIGDARFQGVWTIGMELPFGDGLDGVIGTNVFHKCLLTYDYPGNRIRLSRGSLPKANGRDVLSFSSPGDSGSHPNIELNIGGETTRVMIDTGLTGWFRMPSELAKRFKVLEGPVAGLKSLNAGGSGGREASIVRLGTSIPFGNCAVEKPVVRLTDEGDSPGMWGGMMLGTLLLEHFVVTFDARNSRVRFARESTAPIIPPSVRLLGFNLIRKDRAMEVWSVYPESHAGSLGITEGSLVYEINGRPAIDLYQANEWSDLLQSSEKVTLRYSLPGSDVRQTADIRIFELLP